MLCDALLGRARRPLLSRRRNVIQGVTPACHLPTSVALSQRWMPKATSMVLNMSLRLTSLRTCVQRGNSWPHVMAQLVAADNATAWRDRASVLFWRGRVAAGGHPDGPRQHAVETIMSRPFVRLLGEFGVTPDAKNAFDGKGDPVPLEDWAQHKFVLHLRGFSYSASLKYQLLTGSPVFAMLGDYEEFYHPALVSSKHLFKLKEPLVKEDVAAAARQVMARTSEAEARAVEMGGQGSAFVQRELAKGTIDCYWARAMVRMARRSKQLS